MPFLPDTNVWIRYVNPAPSRVKQKFLEIHPSEIFLSDIVLGEMYYGAFKSSRQSENLALLDNLSKGYPNLSFDARCARIYGEIRADLRTKGSPIGPYDLQIAAVALANSCILVTHNTREFSRIAGLEHVDWEE